MVAGRADTSAWQGMESMEGGDTLQNRHILLIICGGIAAYKSLELIRLLREQGSQVKAVITRAGEKFVTPLSVSALTGNHVNNDLLDHASEADFGHIELARWADLIVVAPATADFISSMANGRAGDLALALLLAARCPVICVPAMNVHMWQKPATMRNIRTIENDGVMLVGPEEGVMACGDYGPGRMSEPVTILEQVRMLLAPAQSPGLTAIVTAGPTREAIDPVRFISNRSSGKQGIQIAEAMVDCGIGVKLVLGPVSETVSTSVDCIHVESTDEMHDAVHGLLPADIFVGAAAVADWRPAQSHASKLKKTAGDDRMNIGLVKNPDILASVAQLAEKRPRLVIGFAAETENLVGNARDKLAGKKCDWIVANDVNTDGGAIGSDSNAVTLVSDDGIEDWPRMSKRDVSRKLAKLIMDRFSSDQGHR